VAATVNGNNTWGCLRKESPAETGQQTGAGRSSSVPCFASRSGDRATCVEGGDAGLRQCRGTTEGHQRFGRSGGVFQRMLAHSKREDPDCRAGF